MPNTIMSAWWADLSDEERTAILIEWPHTGGLSAETLVLLPLERLTGGQRAGSWAWPTIEVRDHEVPTTEVHYAQEFARFMSAKTEEQFRQGRTGASQS